MMQGIGQFQASVAIILKVITCKDIGIETDHLLGLDLPVDLPLRSKSDGSKSVGTAVRLLLSMPKPRTENFAGVLKTRISRW